MFVHLDAAWLYGLARVRATYHSGVTSFQCSVLPAQKGTTSSSPNGSVLGTTHSSRRSSTSLLAAPASVCASLYHRLPLSHMKSRSLPS